MSRSIGFCRDAWCLCRSQGAHVEVSELMPKPGITGRMLLPRSAMQERRGGCFSLSVLMPKPGKSMGGVDASAEESNGMTTGGTWRPREESSNMGTLAGVWHMSSGRGVRYPPRAAHGHFGRSLQTKKNRGDALAEDALAKVCVEL